MDDRESYLYDKISEGMVNMPSLFSKCTTSYHNNNLWLWHDAPKIFLWLWHEDNADIVHSKYAVRYLVREYGYDYHKHRSILETIIKYCRTTDPRSDIEYITWIEESSHGSTQTASQTDIQIQE